MIAASTSRSGKGLHRRSAKAASGAKANQKSASTVLNQLMMPAIEGLSTRSPAYASSGPSAAPVARVVLLGASNLTRALPRAVALARLRVGSPADFLIAAGHGRSYGRRSRVLIRSLPAILECGLWDSLPNPPSTTGKCFALISDIGNDIVYGESPATIAEWIERCLDRLAGAMHSCEIAVSALPLESLRAMSPRRFAVVKGLLFPRHALTHGQAMARIEELHERLIDLARRRRAALIQCPGAWYGLDPIHIRRQSMGRAWAAMLGCEDRGAAPGLSWVESTRLSFQTPQRWWLAGRERGRPQPAATLADGSRISLF